MASSSIPPFPPQGQHHELLDESLEELWMSNRSTIQNIVPSTENWKIQTLPLARVKKIMKSEEFVLHEIEKERRTKAVEAAIEAGQEPSPEDSKPPSKFMISAEAPILMSKACELLVKELTFRSWRHTERNRRRTLQKQDVHAAVGESEVYDFLIDIVPRVIPPTKSSSQQQRSKKQQQQEQPLHFPQHQQLPQQHAYHHQHQVYGHCHPQPADATAVAAAAVAAGIPNEYVIQQVQHQFQLQHHQQPHQNFLHQDQLQQQQMVHGPVPVPAPPAALAHNIIPPSHHQHHQHHQTVPAQGMVTSYHSASLAHHQQHTSAAPGYSNAGVDQLQKPPSPMEHQQHGQCQPSYQYNTASHSTATPAGASAATTGEPLSQPHQTYPFSQPVPLVYQGAAAPSSNSLPGSSHTLQSTTTASASNHLQQQWSTPSSHHHHLFLAGGGDGDSQAGHLGALGHHHHLAGGGGANSGHQISPPK